MKKKFVILFLALSVVCFAVNVKMQYTAKKTFSAARKLVISIADETGETDKDVYDINALALSNYLYFSVLPVSKEDFSKKDTDLIKEEFEIIQNNQEIKPIDTEIKTDSDDNIIALLFLFKKNDIIMYEQFKFKIDDFSSEYVKFDEKFRREYHELIDYYEKGKAAYEKSDYLNSYQSLIPFNNSNPEITTLSYYAKAKQMLDSSVNMKISSINSDFGFLKMKSGSNVDREFLTQIDSLKKYAVYCDSIFSDYFESSDNLVNDLHSIIIPELEKLKNDNYLIYKNNILDEFTRFDYRSDKDRSFISVLTSLLLAKENLLSINQPDFNISIIPSENEPLKYIEQFNFKEEFLELLQMISDNITQKNVVFEDESMSNLYQRTDQEPEPYYNIYSAINHILAKEYTGFWNNMVKALYKCTDSQLLTDLELFILFNDKQIIDMDEINREKFVEALNTYVANDPADIKYKFELIKSLYPDLAVSHYVLAKLADNQGDVFGAYFAFEEVVKYKPEIISAYEYFVQKEINEDKLPQATETIAEIIQNHPAWKLHFLHANVLFQQKKYSEAITVLEENCLHINNNNYSEFILLGDLYHLTNDIQKAKENYMEAGRINSEDNLYKQKLLELDSENTPENQ